MPATVFGWLGRGAAAVTVGASGVIVATIGAPGSAGAAAGAAPTGPVQVPPVTVTANGWIHYNDTQASQLHLVNPTTQTISGSINAKGQCVIDQSSSGSATGLATYESEIAYNPKLCQETVLSGTIDTTTAAAMGARQVGEAAPPGAIPSGPAHLTTALPATAPPGATIRGSASIGASPTVAAAAAATTYKSAYQKDAYLDPLDITITSLAQNLTWGVDDTNGLITSASSWVYPYRFAYDGWYGGTPSNANYKNGAYTAVTELSYYQSENTDFEQLLISLLGVGAVVACGFTTTPAVFVQNMALTGTASGYSVSSADSKSGGCSDLVHRDSENGWGSTT